MHHIKHDARKTAYDDPYNPFGRRRNNTKRSSTSRLEDGQMSGSVLASEKGRYGTQEGSSYQGAPLSHAGTAPESYHPQQQPSSGDDFEVTMSPQSTNLESPPFDEKKDNIQSGSDDTDRTYTQSSAIDQPEHKSGKRKIMGLFGKGKDHGKEAEKDDDKNNGKDGKTQQHFTIWGQVRATLLGSWINVLLILCPVGIALHFAKANPYAIFITNFIAIIPLAGMLSYATEEIALRTGEVIGGLLNASFGNAVELIVSIVALFQNQFLIVQTSLLGSMLSNLLLVMGMCFFAGGINRMEQAFNMTVAQTASSLLFLAVSSLIIPTAFESWALTGNSANVDHTTSGQTLVRGVVQLSRGTAVILLLIYGCYLFFQLKSHVSFYMAKSEKNQKRDFTGAKQKWQKVKRGKHIHGHRSSDQAETPTSSKQGEENLQPQREKEDGDDEEEEQEQPQLSLLVAILTLTASTVLVALNAEFLVDSINDITCESSAISKTFIGLILLPIVGNAAEHATAVTVAIKDKMDLAIGVAVGSSMQIALLVLPLMVVIGWIAGKDDMNLYFDGFQLAMLFVSILLVNYLIQDGKSHWLEGILLMMLYIIIAVAAWFYPTDPRLNNCPG